MHNKSNSHVSQNQGSFFLDPKSILLYIKLEVNSFVDVGVNSLLPFFLKSKSIPKFDLVYIKI
jgi:hypothetical protein